jgi:hypothetical protein
MKGQLPWSVEELCGQRVEQFGRSAALVSSLHDHLSFFDHVHEFDPNERFCQLVEVETLVGSVLKVEIATFIAPVQRHIG